MKILETERLILRRFSSEDWKDLYEYLSNVKAVKYEPYDVFTMDESKQEAVNRANLEEFWAVCLKENKKVIGNLYFKQQQPDEFLTWELGYVFNPLYGRKGYATESCRRIIDYAFKELKTRRITAMCNPKNAPSWMLLERLGMGKEGHLRENMYFKFDEQGNPIWADTYIYSVLSKEWFSNE
ncbi:MAG: GNAT family protein [Bacillota bacterium]|nr:GNAT family protein [Bacillota bacterium]